MRNRRRRGYKFTEKKHSRQGILATVLALALLVWYLVFLKLAFQGGGSLSAYYGSAGVVAMIATFVVLVIAAKSLREEDSFQLFPRLVYFIMGADNWQLFPRWKEHEKILQDYKLLIYPRLGFDISIPAIYPNVKKVDAPLMEISSTFIRNAYQTGKDIRFFLPEGVRPYFGSVANQ